MSFELHKFTDLAEETQESVAMLVSNYTNGKLGEMPQMLPVRPEEIIHRHLGLVAFSGDHFLGYIGAKEPELHQEKYMPEVGSLWVPSQYRKQGVAKQLVISISEDLTGSSELPYAFCNPLSKGIFKQAGYLEAGISDVPESALRACLSCPMKPASCDCCDKILVWNGEPRNA